MPMMSGWPTEYGAGTGPTPQESIANTEAMQSGHNAYLAAEASKYPATLQQQRFNTVWPWLTGQLGHFLTSNPYTIGGSMPQQPHIGANPVYSQQQIQQQVNNTRAQNDTNAASQIRTQQQGLAGRGFGGNSPLAQALSTYTQGQNMATNTNAEQQLRFNSAQANAQQVLAGQQAQQEQYAQNQGLAIQRAQPYFQMQNALIAALGGLV